MREREEEGACAYTSYVFVCILCPARPSRPYRTTLSKCITWPPQPVVDAEVLSHFTRLFQLRRGRGLAHHIQTQRAEGKCMQQTAHFSACWKRPCPIQPRQCVSLQVRGGLLAVSVPQRMMRRISEVCFCVCEVCEVCDVPSSWQLRRDLSAHQETNRPAGLPLPAPHRLPLLSRSSR